MTLSALIRSIAMSIRAEATVVDEGPASALRAQAQRLDDAVRMAERMEHVNAVCLDAVPLHPAMRGAGWDGWECGGVSRTEVQVLIDALLAACTDLRDRKFDERTPLHVATATDAHIKHITEAAKELRRIYGVSA